MSSAAWQGRSQRFYGTQMNTDKKTVKVRGKVKGFIPHFPFRIRETAGWPCSR